MAPDTAHGPEVRADAGADDDDATGEPAEGALPGASAPARATMTVVLHGQFGDDARGYAAERIGSVVDHIREPVLLSRVKLVHQPDPAASQPFRAQATVDINGDLVRAHVGAASLREAIDRLRHRLAQQLEHRAQHLHALRTRPEAGPPGEWRHGDPPTERPDHFPRPAAERELVRLKAYPIDEITTDEAIVEMEQLDFDFYLFCDLATGVDAMVERRGDGGYRLCGLGEGDAAAEAPLVADVTVVPSAAPGLTVREAIERLDAGGEPHVFFRNLERGRGNIVYRRYDGHYGLVSPN